MCTCTQFFRWSSPWIGAVVEIVLQGRKPVDLQATIEPEHGIRLRQYRGVTLLQDRTPFDLIRLASSTAPAVAVKPRDSVHDVWLQRVGTIWVGCRCRVSAAQCVFHHKKSGLDP